MNGMEILQRLCDVANERGLGFILIGGHAVNTLAERRQTRDVDIAVRAARADPWREILLGLGYELRHESDAFMQFAPPDIAEWPLDIMLVNESTFAQLNAEAVLTDVGGKRNIAVASARHLVAMKLHALKQSGGVDKLKHMTDIVMLIGDNATRDSLRVSEPDLKALCLKYADENTYEAIIQYRRP